MPKKGHKFGKYEKPRNPRNPNARMSPLRDSADGTTSLVAVDVGLTALGWARWNRALPAEAGGVPVAPDAAGVIELPSRRDRDPWDVRATAIMAEYVAGPWAGSHGGFGGPPRVQVIEWPAYWAGDAKGNAAAAGEALGKLYFMCGMHRRLGDSYGARTILVPVREWKGQMPKRVVARRIAAMIGCEDQGGRQFTEHAWDAVGIGLHHLGFGMSGGGRK